MKIKLGELKELVHEVVPKAVSLRRITIMFNDVLEGGWKKLVLPPREDALLSATAANEVGTSDDMRSGFDSLMQDFREGHQVWTYINPYTEEIGHNKVLDWANSKDKAEHAYEQAAMDI